MPKNRPSNPASGANPGGTPAPVLPCEQCPSVEIEINDTPATKDDLVAMKSDHPARRPVVNCRIRSTGGGPDCTVVLTNPNGKLRFTGAADRTLSVAIPADGSWVSFQVAGEEGSAALNDAVIEAHCLTATGPIKGKKAMTVFWFDDAHIDITSGGNYAVTAGRFTVTGGNAANLSARARIRPAGVDCTAPQVTNLRVGIMQNALPGTTRERMWSNPTMAWNPGVPAGTTAIVPTTIRMQINRPATGNDSAGTVQPLYDMPGVADTLDANSLQPPTGCPGSAAATSNDTPSTAAPSPLVQPAVDGTGAAVGTVTYRATSVKLSPTFLTWCVIFDTVTQDFTVLRERGWRVNADAFTAGAQTATADGADRAPTTDPVLAPLANTQSNDPANTTQGAFGGATTTFTR